MSGWLDRTLCRLGLHTWRLTGKFDASHPGGCAEMYCRRCGARQWSD